MQATRSPALPLACTVRLVANGSTAEPVRVPLPPTFGALLELSGRALHMTAHSLLDDEGDEVTDLQHIEADQRLFVCGGADEPFLRNRPKRCQLFRVAHAHAAEVTPPTRPPTWATVPNVQDAAEARWHEGKVVAVPKRMTDLRAVAAKSLGLGEVENIRFRSASSGLLIFETSAVADDDLLLVETPTQATAAANIQQLLNGSPTRSARLAGEVLDTLVDVRQSLGGQEGPTASRAATASGDVVQVGRAADISARRSGRVRQDKDYHYSGRAGSFHAATSPRNRQHHMRRRRRSSSSSYSTSSLSPSEGGDETYSSSY
eukprot:COSAG02_NODE_926_length_15856_cov_13.975566_11_plen_318_part_00